MSYVTDKAMVSTTSYTYSGDSAAGQTQGEGLFGKWFVATPDLAKNKP